MFQNVSEPLLNIDSAYEKNRTQWFTMYDQLSNKVTDRMNRARRELTSEHSDTIRLVEREIEEVYDNFTHSGRLSVKERALNSLGTDRMLSQ